jgi:hypothetical protein
MRKPVSGGKAGGGRATVGAGGVAVAPCGDDTGAGIGVEAGTNRLQAREKTVNVAIKTIRRGILFSWQKIH